MKIYEASCATTSSITSLEDDDYVARGNGFCDRKYSDNFIEGQLEKYAQRVKEIERWIAEWK